MERLLNFLLSIFIGANVIMALTLVMVPRTSMELLESFLDNPQNQDLQTTPVNASALSENRTSESIQVMQPVTSKIEQGNP